MFFKEINMKCINAFIKQVHIKLIRTDSKDVYMIK